MSTQYSEEEALAASLASFEEEETRRREKAARARHLEEVAVRMAIEESMAGLDEEVEEEVLSQEVMDSSKEEVLSQEVMDSSKEEEIPHREEEVVLAMARSLNVRQSLLDWCSERDGRTKERIACLQEAITKGSRMKGILTDPDVLCERLRRIKPLDEFTELQFRFDDERGYATDETLDELARELGVQVKVIYSTDGIFQIPFEFDEDELQRAGVIS